MIGAKSGESTRDRIVSAAARLFYVEGIRATSVEAVAHKAGITKKTFYYHFASKDNLLAACLQAQDQPVLDLYARWFTDTEGEIAEKIEPVAKLHRRAKLSGPRGDSRGVRVPIR